MVVFLTYYLMSKLDLVFPKDSEENISSKKDQDE